MECICYGSNEVLFEELVFECDICRKNSHLHCLGKWKTVKNENEDLFVFQKREECPLCTHHITETAWAGNQLKVILLAEV